MKNVILIVIGIFLIGCTKIDIVEENKAFCYGEGEQISTMPLEGGGMPPDCCEGLKKIMAGIDIAYCTKCGDSVCKDPEKEFNCPEDCE